MIYTFVPTQTQAFTSLIKAQRYEMSLFEETKSFKITLIYINDNPLKAILLQIKLCKQLVWE